MSGRRASVRPDIVLDLERITVPEPCELATRLVHSQSRLPSVRSGGSVLNNFALSCRVIAALAMAPETANLELDVAAAAGVVSLSGMVRSPEQLSEVQRVAWSVPAIAGVVLNGVTIERPAVTPDDLERVYREKGKRAPPRWHLLRPAWAQIGLILALTIAGFWSLSEFGSRITANLLPRDGARTFAGVINRQHLRAEADGRAVREDLRAVRRRRKVCRSRWPTALQSD